MQETNNNNAEQKPTEKKVQSDEFFGMKILFDKQVGLYPVKLEKRFPTKGKKSYFFNNCKCREDCLC